MKYNSSSFYIRKFSLLREIGNHILNGFHKVLFMEGFFNKVKAIINSDYADLLN